MRYEILESGTGDSLGVLEVADDLPDERVIELLVEDGILDPPADEYAIDDGFPFSEEGERTVIDGRGEPLLVLDAGEPADDDDDPDADDEIDGEDFDDDEGDEE